MPRKPLHILITAGPTREYLDSVRFISNPSSGKMGYAIAIAAQRRGHRVTLVSGPVDLKPPTGVDVVQVETGAEMLAASRRAFRDADAAVFCAAVCDYRPVRRAKLKLPKSKEGLTLEMESTADIAATLGGRKGHRITVAFALEDHDGRRKAEAKMAAKRSNAIILNGPGNIGSEAARVEFLRRGGEWAVWPGASKTVVAKGIVREIEAMATEAGTAGRSGRRRKSDRP